MLKMCSFTIKLNSNQYVFMSVGTNKMYFTKDGNTTLVWKGTRFDGQRIIAFDRDEILIGVIDTTISVIRKRRGIEKFTQLYDVGETWETFWFPCTQNKPTQYKMILAEEVGFIICRTEEWVRNVHAVIAKSDLMKRNRDAQKS